MSERTRRNVVQSALAAASSVILPVGKNSSMKLCADDQINSRPDLKKREISNAIFFVMDGAPSMQDSFDYKPHAPSGVRGEFSRTAMPEGYGDLVFSELCEHTAQIADKLCIIPTVHTPSANHSPATMALLLEGDFPPDENEIEDNTTLINTRRHFMTNNGRGSSHPYLYIENGFKNPNGSGVRTRSTPFYQKHNNMVAQRRENTFSVLPSESVDLRRLDSRLSLLSLLDKPGFQGKKTDDYQRQFSMAMEMILGGVSINMTSKDLQRVERNYGNNDFGLAAYAAGKFVEAGIRRVVVRTGNWDFHSRVFPLMRKYFPLFDRAFAALIRDISVGNFPENTAVCMAEEFGRTPKLEQRGSALGRFLYPPGRNHGKYGLTALYGNRVRPGVWGQTDTNWEPVDEKKVLQIVDVKKMLLKAAGIPQVFHGQEPDVFREEM